VDGRRHFSHTERYVVYGEACWGLKEIGRVGGKDDDERHMKEQTVVTAMSVYVMPSHSPLSLFSLGIKTLPSYIESSLHGYHHSTSTT